MFAPIRPNRHATEPGAGVAFAKRALEQAQALPPRRDKRALVAQATETVRYAEQSEAARRQQK